MKRRMKLIEMALMLLALLSSSHMASAYYDPGVQRWVNRDPIKEQGGINLYRFIANNSIGFIDLFGLCQRAVKTSQGWADENRPL